MKYLKMLGLAAMAAMVLMAFAANSASATTLTSPEGTSLKKGTTIFASLVGIALLTSTSGETLDSCTAGTVDTLTEQETAAEITGAATVTWGEAGTECTKTTDTLNGGSIGISHSAGINGTVKSFNAEVTVFTLGLSCIYGTSATGTTLGELKGSGTTNATIEANATVEKKGGSFLCPPTPHWVALYKVTKPVPLIVDQLITSCVQAAAAFAAAALYILSLAHLDHSLTRLVYGTRFRKAALRVLRNGG